MKKCHKNIIVEIFDKVERNKIISKVHFYVIENIEGNLVNLNHTVKREVNEVLLVPLGQLNEHEKRKLPLTFELKLAIKKIRKLYPYIFPDLPGKIKYKPKNTKKQIKNTNPNVTWRTRKWID